MITLLKQEIYKLMKRPSLLVFIILLFCFQLAVALIALKYPSLLNIKATFVSNFFAPVLIVFYMIALGSTQLSSEIQYGTLKTLLYRQYSFAQILLSKWLALLIGVILLYVSSACMSVIIKLLVLNNQFALNAHVWQLWSLNIVATFLTLLFLLCFVELIATLFENSTLAIIVGISAYFVISIFNQLMFMMIDQHPWLKWNPVNMLNLGEQIGNQQLSRMTQLTLGQITVGYVVYIGCFLLAGLFIFKKRNSN